MDLTKFEWIEKQKILSERDNCYVIARYSAQPFPTFLTTGGTFARNFLYACIFRKYDVAQKLVKGYNGKSCGVYYFVLEIDPQSGRCRLPIIKK